ncbi:coiled-coil domain-containing protein [Gimesia algae]|uniref:Uncharacterized protein n=1 Tax=Gimesia algae TaxID=2527971 RepID=A0A517VIU4_9PLAN|nr:hypothetical protein [Gimesia algae]QDT92897.1 hypothetical protein Pan161_45680 [Gimesia algae]
MQHSIRTQLEQLHHKIRQLIWLNGLCWGLTLFLGLAALIISLDWMLDISDPASRLLLGLAAGSTVIWILWKHLIVPLKTPLTDLDLALKIERRYPILRDSFSSSIQFDHQSNTQFAGSTQMRQAVIEDAFQRASQINFLELIDTHPLRKIMFSATFLCLLTAFLTLLHPQEVILGLHRLILPFSAPDWPQRVELQILDEDLVPIETGPNNPYQVVEGQTFQFFVENRNGTPPEDLRIEYQTRQKQQAAGKIYSDPLRIVSVPDASGVAHELGTGSLVVSNKLLKLRAVGGDDKHMPWLNIVSVPPTMIQLEQVRLRPPAYTQLSEEILPAGIGNFKVLVGTRVEFKASSNKLLKTVALRIKNSEPVPLKLQPDRKHFAGSFVVNAPGTYSYWFEAENDQGFKPPAPEHYEITATSDGVPEVFLEVPDTDLQVTPAAQIPLMVVVHDDLGIESVLIRYQKSSSQESLSRALRTDRENFSFPLPFSSESSANQRESQLKDLTLTDNWKLAALALKEGDRIIFRAEARDLFQDSTSANSQEGQPVDSHTGTSISRVLTIVSPQFKANELANRQANLLEELARILKDQRLLHTEIKDVQHQLQRVGQARTEEIDTIKQVEMDQKRIASQLHSPRTGLEQRSSELLQELEWNRIEDPAMQQRLAELNTELSQLNQQVFPEIQEQITQARKKMLAKVDARASQDPGITSENKETKSADAEENKRTGAETSPLESLTVAGKGQQHVIERLDNVLKSLAQWQKTRDLVSELDEQIEQQRDIQNQTEKLARKTITKAFGKLKLQEQADLEKLAHRQEQQADHFKAFRNLLDSLNDQDQDISNSEQQRNQEGIDFLRKNSISEVMKQTADKLKQNQVGQALQEQQQLQESMQKLKNIFENQPASSTGEVLDELIKREQELNLIKQKQEDILQKLKKSGNALNNKEQQAELLKLRKQEQELKQQMQQLQQKLQRLSLNKAADSLQRSGRRSSQINEALQQGKTAEAQEQLQESLDDLEQAQRELAARRNEMEESLAFEEFIKLESEIKGLVERQKAVIEETTRLEQERLSRGRWSRGQLKSLKLLQQTEQDLQLKSEKVAEKLAKAPVFKLAIEKAIDHLKTAVDRLDQRLTDELTLDAEQNAESRFKTLLQALNEKTDPEQTEEQSGANQQMRPSDQIPIIAQLRLLKLLQQDILDRTTAFNDALTPQKNITAKQLELRKQLSKEQADLAELSQEILELFNQLLPDDPEQKLEIQ